MRVAVAWGGEPKRQFFALALFYLVAMSVAQDGGEENKVKKKKKKKNDKKKKKNDKHKKKNKKKGAQANDTNGIRLKTNLRLTCKSSKFYGSEAKVAVGGAVKAGRGTSSTLPNDGVGLQRPVGARRKPK